MYLPDEFIRELLVRHGFFHEGDRLYVSETVGACKYDGSLFRYIHDKEHLNYKHWHHYGDNRQSDYRAPRHLGIHAHHLHYDYLHYERQWAATLATGYQYGPILAGVSRAVRLGSDAMDCQKRFVANISAPLMVAWVASIMQDATRRDIQRLYFLARDVHSEYLIARSLNELFPQLDVRYLIISSYALHHSNLIKNYLQSQGLDDDIPMAVIDSNTTGWTLARLNQLLGHNGAKSIHGYFIMHSRAQRSPLIDNSSYLFSNGYIGTQTPKRINRIGGMRIFYELLFSLNYHHTVTGYEYHGSVVRPIFGNDGNDQIDISVGTLRNAKHQNDGMLIAFAKAFTCTGLIQHTDIILKQLAMPTLIDFVDCPRREYCEYLHLFKYWGKPFVGATKGENEGVWRRGNRAFRMPQHLMNAYYAIIVNPSARRRLNNAISLGKSILFRFRK